MAHVETDVELTLKVTVPKEYTQDSKTLSSLIESICRRFSNKQRLTSYMDNLWVPANKISDDKIAEIQKRLGKVTSDAELDEFMSTDELRTLTKNLTALCGCENDAGDNSEAPDVNLKSMVSSMDVVKDTLRCIVEGDAGHPEKASLVKLTSNISDAASLLKDGVEKVGKVSQDLSVQIGQSEESFSLNRCLERFDQHLSNLSGVESSIDKQVNSLNEASEELHRVQKGYDSLDVTGLNRSVGQLSGYLTDLIKTCNNLSNKVAISYSDWISKASGSASVSLELSAIASDINDSMKDLSTFNENAVATLQKLNAIMTAVATFASISTGLTQNIESLHEAMVKGQLSYENGLQSLKDVSQSLSDTTNLIATIQKIDVTDSIRNCVEALVGVKELTKRTL